MSRKIRKPLVDRVAQAAAAALAAQDHVGVVDMLVGIGWLDPGAAERWRRGQIECLEDAVQIDGERLSEVMTLFRAWAVERELSASAMDYVARTPRRQALRFSRSGNPAVEEKYRTHWISPGLADKKREKLVKQASRAPELVVVVPLREWRCHRCGGTGDLLMMENPGPACLRCAGLDDLVFLPAGDALFTRRVKGRSPKCAIVVRFSKTRRRYERQGLLVMPQALADVQRELDARRDD